MTILLFVLFSPVLLFFTFQIPPVQKFLNDKLTLVINEKLNTNVSIGQIVYQAPFDIVLLNLYVEDYQKDTLVNIDYLKVRPLHYGFRSKLLTIDNIKIKGFRTEYRIDSTGFSNFDFFLANLPDSSTDIKEEQTNSTKISVNKISVENSSIFYSTQEKDTIPYQFDLDTFDIQNLSFKIKKFTFQDDSISLKLEKFGFKDKSGFMVRSFSTDFVFTNSQMSIKNFKMRLNKSRFFINNANLNYTSIDQLSENPENVFADIDLRDQSEIVFADLGYFSPLFKNYYERVKVGFIASGNLGSLVSKKLKVRYNTDNYMLANFEIFGLPNIDNMFFDVQFVDLKTNIDEILSLKNPLDNNSNFIELPSSIRIPKMIDYKGGITGKLEDFYFFGDFVSSAGNFSTKMNVQLDSSASNIAGNFTLQSFDIGYVLRNEELGIITMADTIDFSMIDSVTYRGYNRAEIIQAEYNDYNYKDIVADAFFFQDSISANIVVADTNIKANLNCDIKLAGVNTTTKFDFEIDTVRLYPLNFIKPDKDGEVDEYAAFSMKINGNLSGNNVDNLAGNIVLEKPLYLTKNLQLLTIKKLIVEAKNTSKIGDNIAKIISLKSDLVDGYARGTFDFEELEIFGQNIAGYYFPALINDSIVDLFQTSKEISSNLEFKITIKDLQPVTSIFVSKMYLSKNTEISGGIYSDSQKFDMSILADSVFYSENKFKNLKINLLGDSENLKTTINCDSIGVSEFRFEDFKTTIKGKEDTANLIVSWLNKSENKNFGRIRANLIMDNDSSDNLSLKFVVPNDTIVINDKPWSIYSDSIFVDTSGVEISKITLSSYLKKGNSVKQFIGIYGKITKNKEDTLFLAMQKFDISQLVPILPDVKIEGYMNSDFVATGLLETPKVVMTNKINKFAINDVELGEVNQTVKWLDKEKVLHNELDIQKVGKKREKIDGKDTLIVSKFRSLLVIGDYKIDSMLFDFHIIIDNLKLKPFATYLDDYVKFSRNSNLNGDINIKGDKLFYNIDGELNLYGAFLIPKTGVSYTINGGMNVKLEKNLIVIDTTILTGPKLVGDALFYGNVKHQDFNDPFVDFYFRADTIAFLDLPRTNSSKYYGKVVASGNIEVDGYLEDLSMKADIITEKNTNFSLLLDRPEKVSNKTTIVTFVEPQDTTQNEINEEEKSSTDIDLDLNLTLNPDAKFKIIFDELTGEALDIQGEGSVKLKKTALGDIVLLGKIGIEKGEYKFILENIINRKFKIVKGSSIVFNGAPTDGIIDISTVYSIKNVSLYNLLMDENYAEQKTQADCYISLTGEILNPDIRFSVDLPKADKRIASQVQNLDAANQNKQFLSLLIFGRFQSLPGLAFDPDVTGAFNAGELISNQLNSLLSNMNTDIDLDVNYVTGNEQTTDQFDVGASVPLFNDRLSINADVGVGGNTATSTEQNNIIGDFDVDFKLNEKGNIRLKAFNKTNRNEFYDKGPYTQGIGIMYKKDFDHIFSRDTNKINKKDTIK